MFGYDGEILRVTKGTLDTATVESQRVEFTRIRCFSDSLFAHGKVVPVSHCCVASASCLSL